MKDARLSTLWARGPRLHGQARAESPTSAGVETLRSLTVPVPVPNLLELADGLANALSRRHGRVGLHGGLCPDAVLIDTDGQLTILDQPRPLAQRARYAAPEQSGRLSRDVDERADLYALGVL